MQVKIVKKIVQICVLGLVFFPFAAWGLDVGTFENTDSGWTMGTFCKDEGVSKVSIEDGDTYPSYSGTGSAVFFVKRSLSNTCVERDAWLKKTIDIPNNYNQLSFRYRIQQRNLSSGLAAATFQIELGGISLDPISQTAIAGAGYDSQWQEKIYDISTLVFTSEDILFRLKIDSSPVDHELSLILDDVKIQTGTTDPVPGNINGDAENKVDLADAILSLQILAGVDTGTATIVKENDADANGVIGLENPIYILQKVAGLRTEG